MAVALCFRNVRRPSLSTEHSSVLPRVKIPSQRNFHFETCGLGVSARRNHRDVGASNGSRISEFTAYSLFLVAEKNAVLLKSLTLHAVEGNRPLLAGVFRKIHC